MDATTHSPPQLLHHFFDRSAKRFPHQVAIDIPPGPDRAQRQLVSYAELQSHSEALADSLASFARPDSVIGILLPRNSHWLYAAQLAVLKAGAAFTCIEPSFPDSHIQAVIDDAEISVLLTDAAGVARASRAGLRVQHAIDVTASRAGAEHVACASARAADNVATPPRKPGPTNLAYVIYTSGTTGAPKGVMIEHRSIVNLIASDVQEFGLTPDDRVGQGSSAAYDSSVEEIWLAFSAGATLLVMDDLTSRMGPDLVAWMRAERVTVFCPPPTLLRTTSCADPQRELPHLRLLYVGGEALTDDLVDRWARGRRLVNGYGPTECTVTVVRGDVEPGAPVTIGRPVAGHDAWVVDAELKPVADGQPGELCIAGAGLARGYRNRHDVTTEKFPEHPTLGRIYRTGDLVNRLPDGRFVYMGRIDAQVKLRGYRVELEAIEACIAKCDGVREVACCVQGEDGDALIAAHVVADSDAPPDFSRIRDALSQTLPRYMVPARFGLVAALPRSVGGKVDRKRLVPLTPEALHVARTTAPITDPTQMIVAAAFQGALRTSATISAHDDFFLDLGGDSLSAVGVICSLRSHAATSALTTRDLYEARSVAGLAARVASRPTNQSLSGPPTPREPRQNAHPFPVSFAQALWLVMGLFLLSTAGYVVAFTLVPRMIERFGLVTAALLALPLALIAWLGYTLLSIGLTVILKVTLIGKYRTIRTPVWSGYYLRHWIVQSVARAIPWNMLAGTVAYGAVLRLLGAKVGHRVHIHRGVNLNQGGWDLLSIGDDVTLARDAHVGLVELNAGCLCIGPVTLHDDVTLDIRASVSSHTTIETGGYLTALSWLPHGRVIDAGQRWDGVPAVHSGQASVAASPGASTPLHPALHAAAHLAIDGLTRTASTIPALAVLLLISTLFRFSETDIARWWTHPTLAAGPVIATLLATTLTVPIWLALRALLLRCVGTVKPGTIHRWSLAYIRVWHKASELEAVGTWLTGTLFWPVWLRLAGMKIGRDCEISTIIDVVPETVRIGDECFLADGIYLAGPRVHRGVVEIGQTSLGRGTFLGNHVVIPSGAQLADNLFVGVCTVAETRSSRDGTSWFGHPPLELPRRDVVHADRTLTHRPGVARYCSRLFWESLRFTIPVLPIALATAWLWAMTRSDAIAPGLALLAAPLISLAVIVIECLAVIVLKWCVLGKTRVGQHPLWSCWCSRWDFLYVAWQFYALRPLAALEGTLFLAMYLRAMGSKIGRRVVLGPGLGQIADPDMIIIEDDATVSANYQAHSFEDRVLKLGHVVVRCGATVGESAVLFYGADIGAGAWITPNSVVMKNERLAPNQTFSGCPVQPFDHARHPVPAAKIAAEWPAQPVFQALDPQISK